MENFLKEKLQQDYMDCVRIDKAISAGLIDKEEGVHILYDLIDYVRSDIATMDEVSFEILTAGIKRIEEESEKRKVKIEGYYKPKDASERRDTDYFLMVEDYKTAKEILFLMQNLCYKKGWFQ